MPVSNPFGAPPPIRTVADYSNDLAQADHNQLALQTGQMNLLQARQTMADQNALRTSMASLAPTATDQDRINALKATNTPAGYAQADVLAKGMQDRELHRSKMQENDTKTLKDKIDIYHQQLAGVNDYQSAVDLITRGSKDPILGPQINLPAELARIPKPEQDPDGSKMKAYIATMNDEALSAKERADKLDKDRVRTEANRHNVSTEGNSAAQLLESVREHKARDAIAGGQLAVSQGQLGVARAREGREATAPKGVITQTDQGTMLVDPRTGAATPVTADGVPLGGKLKDIPASINTAIITNTQNVKKVDQALALLKGKSVGELKGDSGATGYKGYLPNGILNRVDPEGTDTRAMVADIGSLVLHDRSGAAVTASETPRLLPFIPLATDDNATATKKLTRFKQIYEQETQALGETYNKANGYRDSPLLTKKPDKPGGNLSAAEQAELAQLRGRFGKK